MPIYYLEVNIICIVILIAILDKFREEYTNNVSANYYQKLIVSTIYFSLFDLVAGIFRGTMYPSSRFLLLVGNSLYFMFGTLISYYFTFYVMNKICQKDAEKQKKVLMLPVLLIVALLIINIFTGILFVINENNLYSRGNFIAIYVIITFLYAIKVLGFLLHHYLKNKSDDYMKGEISKLFLSTIIIIISTIIQNLNYGVTLCQVGFTIAILFIYLNTQKKNSNIDELTCINNRRAFNRNAERMFDGNNMMFLMLMDANDFKQINDKFGHIAGDNALIEIANILKEAIRKTNKDYFLARYGGDEFIIVGEIKSEEDVKKLIAKIESEEKILNEVSHNPYKISLSIGYSIKNNTHLDVADLIKDADTKMYKEKSNMKKNSKKITA